MQNDIISRSKLFSSLKREAGVVIADLRYIRLNAVLEKVRIAPAIEAVGVVHARWVHDDLGHTYCSKCHERIPYIHCYSEEPCSDYDEEWDEEIPETRYCPHCGAKMDLQEVEAGG